MRNVNKWLGPISGILFVAAVLLGGGLGFDAEPSDSTAKILAEFRANADGIQTAGLLTVLGIGFLLVFLGYLRTRLRDSGVGWAADAFLAGGVALAGALMILAGVQQAGGVAGQNGHVEVAQGVVDFMWEGSYLFSPGLLAVGMAGTVTSFFDRRLPIWLGVFAVAVALGALAPWMGIFVFLAWVLAMSVIELIQASQVETTAAVG